MPTLVARITSLRLPDFANHLPMRVSDPPPLSPATHREYTSAVSTKFNPASTARSSRRNASASGTVHPKTLPPRQITGTSGPAVPSFRFSICDSPLIIVRATGAEAVNSSARLIWLSQPPPLALQQTRRLGE